MTLNQMIALLLAGSCLACGAVGFNALSGDADKRPAYGQTGQAALAETDYSDDYASLPKEQTAREEPAAEPTKTGDVNRIEIPQSQISLSKEESQAAKEMNIAPLEAEAGVESAGTDAPAKPLQEDGGSLNGEDCRWKKRMLSTAYGPPWNSVEGGPITSTGKALVPNRYYIATDPSVIPTGSKVKIWPNPLNYRGVFRAEDVGGAIKGNHIDIFVWQGKSLRDSWKKNVQVCLLN